MRIAIGSDHRGVQVKSKLIVALENLKHSVEDCGTQGEQSVDYPDFAKQVCERVAAAKVDRGILICGTGIGMSITANKFTGVRAASCYDEVMAEMCRRHNDVNVLCLPGDLIGNRPVADLVRVWLETAFEGGRHERRLEKIAEIEAKYQTKK
ncbi:MAG: ribose 5-phosphate isomerase B [Pirellulaceae bacterium]|nr:ribose 5-phosphate isomerase B [Pirellulaceae bacterium]